MDTEELLPRLALFGGLIAVVLVYRQRRGGRLKKVQGDIASMPHDVAENVAEAGAHSVSLIEGLLDNVAEQALKELKVVLKDGLKRLEKTVEAL